MKFNEIITNITDWNNKVVAKYNQFYSDAPTISWELIYNLLKEQYGEFDVLDDEAGFLRDLNVKLTDLLPKYNQQWKIAFDTAFKNISVKELLQNGTIATNNIERNINSLNNTAENPSDELTTGSPDKFNFDYVNTQIQDKMSEASTTQDVNLQASTLSNIAKWVNTRIQITGLRTFTKSFEMLFNGFFIIGDENEINENDLDTDDIANVSAVPGITTSDALDYLNLNKFTPNFENIDNDTDVPGPNGKIVINTLNTNIKGNTNDIGLNNTEIGTNAINIDLNTKKLVNVNIDGTVKDNDYDPDNKPYQFATQKMIKDNTGGIDPKLEKHLDYSDEKEITIFSNDKNKPNEGSYIKLDSQEISIGVKNSNILTLLDNGTNKAATIDANLQLNSHKIGGLENGTAQTDAVSLQQVSPTIRDVVDIKDTLTKIQERALKNIHWIRRGSNNGNPFNTTYDPDINPNQFATKKMIADNKFKTVSYKDMTSEVANKLITVKQPTLVLINQYNWNEFELCDYNNLEQFTVGSDTHITDRFKIVLYGIKGTKHSGTNTTKAKAVFYFDINDINVWSVEKENEVLAEVFLPDRNGNVGAFQIRIRFTFYRKINVELIIFSIKCKSYPNLECTNISISIW